MLPECRRTHNENDDLEKAQSKNAGMR
jgi:hypothetical protein